MATMKFNQIFSQAVYNFSVEKATWGEKENKEYVTSIVRAATNGAMFDARCFNIPREEVTNLIYWRELDAMRNSVQMVGQANFSHKQLNKKIRK